MPRRSFARRSPNNPLIWLLAILCCIIAIAVIIAGIVVFAIYMIYQPKLPYVNVVYAHLDKLDYDQSGLLDTQITLSILAENDNIKAHASFSDVSFKLGFRGITIAELRADPFDVPKNSTVALNYVVPSSTIPLNQGEMEGMDFALKKNRVAFDLTGKARTRWRVGILHSVKFWTHLSCQLQFFPLNGSSLDLDCSSKSH